LHDRGEATIVEGVLADLVGDVRSDGIVLRARWHLDTKHSLRGNLE
jgi:hypothetical protein